jgi:pyruvate-formate lyase-activating enzyme
LRVRALCRRISRATFAGTAVLSVLIISPARALAQERSKAAEQNPRWAPIRRVFGQGEVEGSYFRINLPRSDLRVRIGTDELSPRFEFTSYVGFASEGTSDVLAMGEVILLQSEVPAVLMEAHRQGIDVTAVHNHLMNETPRIMYVHVMAEGAPGPVASKLRAVFAKSSTPLTPPTEEKSTANWSSIDAALGPHAEAEGAVAEYVFPRHERLSVHGVPVESSGAIETASEVVFQQLGGGRVASTGELFILPNEVESVVRALDEHGLHVTALHNHMVDDLPRMYWVHWYATGDGPTLARGVASALSHMNGARRSVAER